jgi:hypothetical protein
MSVQEKFEAARAVLEQHNAVLGGAEASDKTGQVDPDKFIQGIKLAGGTTEERLKGFSYEDILQCFPYVASLSIKPVPLAKDIAKIFRGKEDGIAHEARPVSSKKADKMTLLELVQAYDPEESENPVGKRLKNISNGEKFIVFATGRTVDIDTTVKLLQEVKQGYEGRNNIEVNGEIKEVHAIGALPDNFVEENPLYRGRPLRPDGTCDQTNRSWNGVPMVVRQLIRVAMDKNILKDTSIERVHDIMDMVVEGNAFDKFAKRYPDAAVEFKKLEGIGKLPTLRLILNKDKGAGGAKRPFDKAKKVEWSRNYEAFEKYMTDKNIVFTDRTTNSYHAFYDNWKKENH